MTTEITRCHGDAAYGINAFVTLWPATFGTWIKINFLFDANNILVVLLYRVFRWQLCSNRKLDRFTFIGVRNQTTFV